MFQITQKCICVWLPCDHPLCFEVHIYSLLSSHWLLPGDCIILNFNCIINLLLASYVSSFDWLIKMATLKGYYCQLIWLAISLSCCTWKASTTSQCNYWIHAVRFEINCYTMCKKFNSWFIHYDIEFLCTCPKGSCEPSSNSANTFCTTSTSPTGH